MKKLKNNSDLVALLHQNGMRCSRNFVNQLKEGKGEQNYKKVWINVHRGVAEVYHFNEDSQKIALIISVIGEENVARAINMARPQTGTLKFRGMYKSTPCFKIGNKSIPTVINTTTLPLSLEGLLKHKGMDVRCPSFVIEWCKHHIKSFSTYGLANYRLADTTFFFIRACVTENLCLLYLTGNVFLIIALTSNRCWSNSGTQMSNISKIKDKIVFELFNWSPERIAHLKLCFQKYGIKLKVIIKKQQ
jgi:hypothetical protein